MKIKIIDLGEHVDGEQNIKSVIVQGDKMTEALMHQYGIEVIR
jgi:hypothetical protein